MTASGRSVKLDTGRTSLRHEADTSASKDGKQRGCFNSQS
jgi:hypothetical protein